MTVSPWFFFLYVVRWTCAVFGSIAAAVAIVLFLIAVITAVREALL
jgi:hypothetical protein